MTTTEERARAFPIGASVTLEQLDEDPHPVLHRLRASEPVSWVPACEAWMVTSRPLVLQAMRDAETYTVDDPRFSTARVTGPSMLSTDGADHGRHRDPFARAFRLAEVRERFTGVIEAEIGRLIDGFTRLGRVDLRTAFSGPLAVRVVMEALGLEGI